MSEKTIQSRVVNKHDTAVNWAKATTFVPKQGEIIVYDKDSTYNYERFKIGDGVTNVNSLPFADDTKVDKVSGKGLSTNDYTTAEKNKLAGIATGATKVIVDSSLSTTSTNPVQNKLVTTAINNLNDLVGDTSVADQISSAVMPKLDSADATWTQIFDSGEITSNVNAISNITIAGYKSLMVVIKCVNTNKTTDSRAGAIYLGGTNGQFYIFGNIFTNLLKKGTTISGAIARFKIVDGFIICENAMQTSAGDNILSNTEGAGVETLVPVNGGIIRCTVPLAAMAVTSVGWSTSHYYGAGSRVVVWGCKV